MMNRQTVCYYPQTFERLIGLHHEGFKNIYSRVGTFQTVKICHSSLFWHYSLICPNNLFLSGPQKGGRIKANLNM